MCAYMSIAMTHTLILGVNNCEILRHHNSREFIYHDCDDYYIMPTFIANRLHPLVMQHVVASI